MFVLKKFLLYDNLTHVQLCNTYVKKYFVCLIFVLFDKYEHFLPMKISRITVKKPNF